MDLFLVGIGGALGGAARYSIGRLILRRYYRYSAAATFIVNISGAFLLGLLSGRVAGGSMYLFLGEGFLGTYTTFSAFMYDSFYYLKEKQYLKSVLYLSLTFALGIGAYLLGFKITDI